MKRTLWGVHVRTDPACLRYRAPRPGSRRDRASRGRSCDYCMVLRQDFGVRPEPAGSDPKDAL